MSSQSIFLNLDIFELKHQIGEGATSCVYCIREKSTSNYYAAKELKFKIDESTQDDEKSLLLFREVNLMALLNHPSILKFVGYSQTNFDDNQYPIIISEFANNGSLRDILEMEMNGLSPDDWSSTKKLIIIYGIASGLSYMHEHNVIHRDLKPENILLDDFLYPKISDFGLSKITDIAIKSLKYRSQRGYKGTIPYMAPEIFTDNEYSILSDVYAFGFIVFEILTAEALFENLGYFSILTEVIMKGFRPKIKEDIPDAYRDLIERCWSKNKNERPTFDNIVDELKTKKEFITDLIDESEFLDYVDYIDAYKCTFDVSDRLITFDDFIKTHSKDKMPKKVTINKVDYKIEIDDQKEQEERKSILQNPTPLKIVKSNQSPLKIVEDDDSQLNIEEESIKSSDENSNNSIEIIYPLSEFNKLDRSCQEFVEESRNDPVKQFVIGKLLIEGQNNFPKNVELGLQYIKQSMKRNYLDAYIYYIKQLIKGKIIPRNLYEAEMHIIEISQNQDNRLYFLRGKVFRKINNFILAKNNFEKGVNIGDRECMYAYGKILFLGEGIKMNVKEAIKYFTMSKNKGYKKSEYFLIGMDMMNAIKGFSSFPPVTQLFFISRIIKILENNNSKNEIKIPFKKTELFFINKSLKSPIFAKCLERFESVYIDIEYPSKLFKRISDLVIKIKNKNNIDIKIGIYFTSLPIDIIKNPICFSNEFSYHIIDESIDSIPRNIFKNCATLKRISILSPIISIEESTFYGCSSLTQITIPSSITSIGDSSFSGCSSLLQIAVPSSVTSIGNYAFHNCSSLTKISFEIPSSVSSIGNNVFYGCISLKQILIPPSVTSLGYISFQGFSLLTNFSIPSSLVFKGNFLFTKCSSLTEIVIPSYMRSIDDHCFNGCKSLKNITFEYPSSVKIIGEHAFNECSLLSRIDIPPSVTSIKKYAFSGCLSLKQISIPSSVTSFGYNIFNGITSLEISGSINKITKDLFKGCTTLAQITITSSITKIDDNTFDELLSLKKILIASSIEYIGSKNFQFETSLEIIGNIKRIPDELFSHCQPLKQIIIPSCVSEIGNYAFRECHSLIQISIPSSVTSIGEGAFYRCSSLKQISIPSSVTSIGESAFYGCSSLTQISIPSSVASFGNKIFDEVKSLEITGNMKHIPDYFFNKCYSLTRISIPSSVASIGKFAFEGCSSLMQISFEIPSSITEIGEKTFYECKSLMQISIPSSVASIGKFAFEGCSSLKQISFEIPSSITEIGEGTFYGCESLTQITIPSSVISIREFAFDKCSSLKQISFPSSVTSIGKFAFDRCSSLAQISIPSSVTKIEAWAFYKCSSLTQITIPSSVTEIGAYAFSECSSLTQIKFFSSVISIGKDAFSECSSLTTISTCSLPIPDHLKFLLPKKM